MAIMHGAFLHILADTMGSVGVIISTCLIEWFGWQRADPIASIFIAALTLLSVKGLLTETTQTLLQRSPVEFDASLPRAYAEVMRLGKECNIKRLFFCYLTPPNFSLEKLRTQNYFFKTCSNCNLTP